MAEKKIMNKFKNNIKGNFTTIPNSVVTNKDLSWKAKGIFTYLASKPDDWQFFMDEINKNATDGINSLKSGIKELEKAGLLVRTKSVNKQNRFIGWNWELKIPDSVIFRRSEIPSVENSDGRKTMRYTNTNLSNTDISNTDNSKSYVEIQIGEVSIYEFEQFWNDYNKKVGRAKCETKYSKIPEAEREQIKEFLKIYIHATPNIQYRLNPETFLNRKTWQDDWQYWINKAKHEHNIKANGHNKSIKQSHQQYQDKLDNSFLDEITEEIFDN